MVNSNSWAWRQKCDHLYNSRFLWTSRPVRQVRQQRTYLKKNSIYGMVEWKLNRYKIQSYNRYKMVTKMYIITRNKTVCYTSCCWFFQCLNSSNVGRCWRYQQTRPSPRNKRGSTSVTSLWESNTVSGRLVYHLCLVITQRHIASR